EALRLVEIDWEVLPFIIDWNKSLEPGAPVLFPDVNPENNVVREGVEEYGDVETGLAEAPNVIDVQINVDEDVWAGVEGGCAISEYKGDNNIEIWSHDQLWDGDASSAFADPVFSWLDYNRLFFHRYYGGGVFGTACTGNYVTNVTSMTLAKKIGKPINYLYDGTHFRGNGEHLGTYNITIGFKDNGEVTAVKYHNIWPGHFLDDINKIHKGSKIHNLYIHGEFPAQNRGHEDCYKHGDQACLCHNEVFAQVAAALEMDPTEVALINDGCAGQSMEWVNENIKKVQGFDHTRDSLQEVLEIGKAAIGWDEKWHLPGTKILPNGNYHGIGFIWMIGWAHDFDFFKGSVGMRILDDGKVIANSESFDTGENRETTYTQVIADELGMKYEDVVLRTFDPNVGFTLGPPAGSSGLVSNMACMVRLGRKGKQMLLEHALLDLPSPFGPPQPSAFSGLTIDDIDIKDSMIFEKANPENVVPVSVLAAAYGKNLFFWDFPPALTVTERPAMCRQCYFQEVEVDPDTGKCHVKKVVVVNDAGKVINIDSYEGQQYGGTYMGLGRCNTEQVIWDPQQGVK
ncbi:MAG: molybdopterin-dependent oxidoreductase, partial [Candidatus Bathyarchaeota archaeon]|nr:molybdopterin-dependent oxidoreductase [Candidatus Bathyarchaeota archaeon]